MNQAKKARIGFSYKKFRFMSVDAAEEAKQIMEKEFPLEIFKVSDAGSLFYRESGNLMFDMKIRSLVHALGGVDP